MRMLVTLMILVALFGLVLWQYNTQLKVLEKHQKQKQTQVASQESAQEHECSETAFARYRMLGLESNRAAKYKGHFNTTLNECYALIETADVQLDTRWNRITLYQGDGKVFGTYGWHSQPGRKDSEIPAFNCDVQMPTGEHRTCGTEAEFRFLADSYMK